MEESNITRGGEFIIKETSPENIFTPEDFSEEQKMMKQAVTNNQISRPLYLVRGFC